jgi:hypothetical protein
MLANWEFCFVTVCYFSIFCLKTCSWCISALCSFSDSSFNLLLSFSIYVLRLFSRDYFLLFACWSSYWWYRFCDCFFCYLLTVRIFDKEKLDWRLENDSLLLLLTLFSLIWLSIPHRNSFCLLSFNLRAFYSSNLSFRSYCIYIYLSRAFVISLQCFSLSLCSCWLFINALMSTESWLFMTFLRFYYSILRC